MKTCSIERLPFNIQLPSIKSACSSVLLLASVVTSGLVQAQQDDFLDKIDDYLYESGADEHIAGFPQSMMNQVEQQLAQGGLFDLNDPNQAAIASRLTREVSVLFTEENITRSVVNSLEDSVSIKSLDSAIAFYNSPVGELSKQIEKESQNVMEDPDFIGFFQQFEGMSKEQPRVDLATRMVELYKMHEFMVDIGIDSEIASLMGMADHLSEEFLADKGFSEHMEMLVEQFNSMREPSYDSAFSLLQAMEYYTYRDMDFEDFAEYNRFHATPEAVSINTAILDGLKNFTIDAFYVVGGAIAEELNEIKVSSID